MLLVPDWIVGAQEREVPAARASDTTVTCGQGDR